MLGLISYLSKGPLRRLEGRFLDVELLANLIGETRDGAAIRVAAG